MRYLVSISLLMCGVFIYVFLRQNVWFLTPFMDYLPEQYRFETVNLFNEILIKNLPDAFWFASLLCLQENPFYGRTSKITISAICLPFIYEGAQGLGLIIGYFDIMDLLSYLAVLLIFIIIWKKEKKLQEKFSLSAV